MKKTSIIFLAIALMLIITGTIIVNVAESKAEKKDIQLYRQILNKNGDLIETIEFSPTTTNKINISLDDTDVNVIGNAKKSYVEIVNFSALDYAAYLNNRALTIENDLLSSIINRAENGKISFNGVHDYIRSDKHNPQKKINIYLAKENDIKIFDIEIKNGNVSVSNFYSICDFNIKIEQGDLTYKNTPALSLINAEINKGNVNIDNTFISNTKINIENGNLKVTIPSNMIIDYTVVNEAGNISYNNESFKGRFTLENEDINGSFSANIGVGSVTINSSGAPYTTEPLPEQPAESTADSGENSPT